MGVTKFLSFICLLCVVIAVANAEVPPEKTFHFVNSGKLESATTEYDADFRQVRAENRRFETFPFVLCFYNTTPDASILAIGAGAETDEPPRVRWVWDANRNSPVADNSSLTFTRDGNLVLADAHGRMVWQTATAGKGVTDLKLLPNGNLVLVDARGGHLWQSFDYPTDTLLAGQSIRIHGRDRLISRVSAADPSDGQYGIRLESTGFNAYLNFSRRSLVFGGWRGADFGEAITFEARPMMDNSSAYELVLSVNQSQAPPSRRLLQVSPTRRGDLLILNKLNYNATYSFLRLGYDGNLRAYTYYDKVRYLRWTETFAYFSRYFVSECQLPATCGSYGLCERGMCVACPTPGGLLGWTDACRPPVVGCPGRGGRVDYYRIGGVDHFLSIDTNDGQGPMKLEDCREKCSRDCQRVGFFYKNESSKCLTVPVLGTLISIKGEENNFRGFIKYRK